jgi:hypothetical protein
MVAVNQVGELGMTSILKRAALVFAAFFAFAHNANAVTVAS